MAYTAPHWPLHAHDEDIARYKGKFDKGWDKLREERLERLVASGILDKSWPLSERDPTQPAWTQAKHKEWLLRCMEVYAAQIDRMDQGIGRILRTLEEEGQLDNTLIIFLSDNGACAEDIPDDLTVDELVNKLMIAKERTRAGEPVHFGNDPQVMPGPENTYQSYGRAWANLSNSPFRLYKHWIHEGGISTPLIVHWPAGIEDRNAVRHTPGYLPDIMATIVEATGAHTPRTGRVGRSIRWKATACCLHCTARRASARRCSGSMRAMRPCASASGSWCANTPTPGSCTTWSRIARS